MNKFILLVLVVLLPSLLFGQNIQKRDTTYVLDSVWRNDSLFIYKKMKITVYLVDTTPKIDSTKFNDKIFVPNDSQIIRYSMVSNNQNKKSNTNFFENDYFSNQIGFGFSNYCKKQTNIYLDSVIKSNFVINTTFLWTKNVEKYQYISGFGTSIYFDNFLLNEKWFTIDSFKETKIEDNSFWNVDTLWYLDLDSLLIGDSVWVPYYDSAYVKKLDTFLIDVFDTTDYEHNFNKNNYVAFFEIPLLIGRKFEFNNFIISANTGIILGFVYSNNYRIAISKSENFVSPLFSKINYWAYFSINAGYNISSKLNIYAGIWTKYPLNYSFILLGTGKKYYSFGLMFGITYKL